jgi:hypothetical protein
MQRNQRRSTLFEASSSRRATAGLFLIALLYSCRGTHRPATSQEATIASAPAAGPRPIPSRSPTRVAVGTPIEVTLIDGLGTSTSSRGDVFTARIDKPLRAVDGTVVAPARAKLTGRVLDVGKWPEARLELSFTTIETLHGRAPISAVPRSMEGVTWIATRQGAPSSYIAIIIGRPPSPPGVSSHARPIEFGLRIPAGARITLELVDPLVIPSDLAPVSLNREEAPEGAFLLESDEISRLSRGSSTGAVQCFE